MLSGVYSVEAMAPREASGDRDHEKAGTNFLQGFRVEGLRVEGPNECRGLRV